ncbi:ScbA/BarX family gamma-butyrolactone biosynthesis protein [Streptomyces sp. NPDC050560]|uniref:ScbA/BarX family gamma-butyrolactone biosynthesis protein n=1 Tax=Streptomyces sp. NPDC050560 TaxID=3365630 RepID=UPI00378E09E0
MTATVICDTPADIMMLTHRVRARDLFVTGPGIPLGDGVYRVPLRFPYEHPFYAPASAPAAGLDPLLLIEAMRQASIMVSHTGLGVPPDHHFMLTEMAFACRPRAARTDGRPVDMELDIEVREIRRRAGRPTAMRCAWTLRRGAEIAARARASTRYCAPVIYERLRGGRPPLARVPRRYPLLPAESVGRTAQRDVLLAADGGQASWLLSVDTGHPTLFQHANDHVPGMVLLEAARQAATVAVPGPFAMTAGHIFFRNYAELDEPCVITARARPGGVGPGGTRVGVEAWQDGRQVFSSLLVAAGAHGTPGVAPVSSGVAREVCPVAAPPV